MADASKRVKKIKVVAFDFDGVIVDSNRLKRDAWLQIFPEELDISKEEIVESMERVRETRFDILRDIFLKKGIPAGEKCEMLVLEYAEKFNQFVQAGMVLMPEVMNVLPRLSKKAPLYVNSSTPVEPLRETAVKLGIAHYFQDILGHPPSKKENLHTILAAEQTVPEGLVFIGDGEDDLAAARFVGCPFLGVPNEFNRWSEGVNFQLVSDFSMIESKLDF